MADGDLRGDKSAEAERPRPAPRSCGSEDWPHGDTPLTGLIRGFDWSRTELGPPGGWPAHLRTMVDVMLRSPAGMALLWGPRGVMIYNDAYAEIVRDRHPGLLGAEVVKGWPEVADFLRVVLGEVLAGKPMSMSDQQLILDRGLGPETLYFDLSFSPVANPTGQVDGVLALVGKPTAEPRRAPVPTLKQQRRINEALAAAEEDPPTSPAAETERHLTRLIHAVVDYAIYMLDVEGRVSTWNPGAQRIKGYTPQEIVGEHFSRFYTEEDRASGEPARALQIAATQGKYEKEAWRVRKDGTRFWANILIDPIRAEDGSLLGYAKITRDITDRRNTETALQEAREALFQSQKMDAVGKLTAGIAHDFNNMLAGIIGAMRLIERRIRDKRYDEVEQYIDAAIASANRAAALTARLLAFGRRQSLDVKPTDVNATLASMEDLLRRTLGENITIFIRPHAPLRGAMTDVNQLENAILNLAINARDAMPSGGALTIETSEVALTARARAELKDAEPGNYIRLRVRDTGHGMPAEVLERAFDPFFTTKPQGQGAGLGLSTIYGFARQVGGFVHIESEVDRGTSVDLYMPVAEAAPSPEQADEKQPPLGAGETILVVEDDATVRLIVMDLLRELGYQTVSASEALEALAVLESNRRLDLLLTDVGLPGGINGRQLAEMARQKRPNLRVLMMTGYAEAAAMRGGFLGPGMDLISKPFPVEALAEKVRGMMGQPS